MAEEIKKISEEKAMEIIEDGGVHIRSIIEVMGKPKEHVDETLLNLLKKLSEEKAINIIKYDIEEAIGIEESSLFSTFAEVEFVSKSINDVMNYAVDYTPSSIEVIEPASMTVQANFISNLMTELVGRIHTIDGEFRKVVAKNKYLSESLTTMIKNAILIYLIEGPKGISRISEIVGVEEKQTKFFLDKLIEENKISFSTETETYDLVKE